MPTIIQLAAQRVERIRLSTWPKDKNLTSYLKLDLLPNGSLGPWGHLYDPIVQEIIGVSTPQDILLIGLECADFEAYKGPLQDETKIHRG